MFKPHEQPAELLIPEPPVALAIRKCGGLRTIGKLVHDPYGDLVLGIPYKGRPTLDGEISVPCAIVKASRRAGAKFVVVRFETPDRHECRSAPFDHLDVYGLVRPDHGVPEIFIRLDRLRRTIWHDWPYARRVVEIPVELESEDGPAFVRPVAVQMGLFESVAA